MTEFELTNVKKYIKLAKKNGIKRLKIGNIELEFENSPAQSSRAFKSTKGAKKIIEQQSAQDQFNKMKDNLAIMHIEDPLAFEQALIENDITDTDDIISSEGNSDGTEDSYNSSAQ